MKSLKHLTDIYFQSVGYNSVLLLNIPPDRRGLIHEADVARLREFAAYRRQAFANNAVQNGQTLWTAHAGEQREYALKPGSTINVVLLQEDIARGQRVEDFMVEARVGGTWQQLGKGTTVGYKRMLRFPAVEADAIRLTIGQTRLEANIANVAAYYAEPVAEEQAQASWNDLPRDGWKKMSDQPLVIDLGKEVTLKGFTYAPQNEQAKPTMAYRYKFYVSLDGNDWKEVSCNGEFSNIMHNPLPQTVLFGQKARARFIKLEATTPEASPAVVALEEIGVSLSDAKDN